MKELITSYSYNIFVNFIHVILNLIFIIKIQEIIDNILTCINKLTTDLLNIFTDEMYKSI